MNNQVFTLAKADCCDLANLVAYLKCEIPPQLSNAIDQHLASCDRCQDSLKTLIENGVEPDWLTDYRDALVPTIEINAAPTAPREIQHSPNPPSEQDSRLPASAPASQRYQLRHLCGEGGMGRVWDGWDSLMQRRVALKQLRAELHHDGYKQRLLQEASSLARLSHPNIVAVYEVLADERCPMIVMEFVAGPTLAALRKEFIFTEHQAAKILIELTDAIVHAHERGIIHRDLKPGNVLLAWPENVAQHASSIDLATPKLTDFGLAKNLSGDELTRAGDLLGTPAYMAPEQTLGRSYLIGPAADIYGLGAILYELLIGTPPHVAENPMATILAVREREPVSPRILRADLSPDMETLCLKCLRKHPKERYASARQLHDDLVAFVEGRPIRARPLSAWSKAIRWSCRHKSMVSAMALGFLFVMTILAGSLWTAKKERRLRLIAEAAQEAAKRSDLASQQEAIRANQAIKDLHQHFDVALYHVKDLAHFVIIDAKDLSPHEERDLYRKRLTDAIQAVYPDYLKKLPDPSQWSFDETANVVRYVKHLLQAGLDPPHYLPGLDRLRVVIPRIQKENPDQEELHRVIAWYHQSLAMHHAFAGESEKAAKHYEEAALSIARLQTAHQDAKLALWRSRAEYLTHAAEQYNAASKLDEALQLADQAVEIQREVVMMPSHTMEDNASFLDKLVLHRKISDRLNNVEAANKYMADLESLVAAMDQPSPYLQKVHAAKQLLNRPPQPIKLNNTTLAPR